MPIVLRPSSSIAVGAVRILSIDVQAELSGSETITGTPTITEATSVFTITNVSVSSAELTINDKTVAIGKAIQCLVDATSAVDGTTYTLAISATTTSSPAETLKYEHNVEAV